MRPVTSASKSWRMSADPANSTSDNRAEVTGESILYAIHPKREEDTEVAVTKYRWDNETMRYIQCKARRVVSAPATVPTTSLHLQKLFRAAQQSELPAHRIRQQRSQTAKARWNTDQTLLHNSERTSQTSTQDYFRNSTQLTQKSDAEKLIPLSFEQAAQTNKVIPICGEKRPEQSQSMSETIPVVFNKDYTPKPYTPSHSSRRPDGFVVHQEKAETVRLCGRRTAITKLEIIQSAEEVSDIKESPRSGEDGADIATSAETAEGDSDKALTPQDMQKASAESCQDGVQQTAAEQVTKPLLQKKRRSSRYKFSFKTPPNANMDRVRTPKLPEEVRSHIIRQCTMPSYAVMHQPQSETTTEGEQTPSTKAVAVERFTETKDRVKNATKPVFHPFVDRNTTKSTPTITPNGPSGSKIFMSITLPKDTLLTKKVNKIRPGQNSHSQQTTPSPPPRQTPQELHKLLIDSTKPQDRTQFRALSASRGRSITLTPKRTSVSGRKSSRSSVQEKVTASHQTSPSARHVDVNIPTAGETSGPTSATSYSGSDDTVSRSCDLDDVRSEDSDAIYSPLPPTPIPEKEDTEAMKQRVRKELMKTLSETEQFLRAMDDKRKNKPPQIVYSDDEDILPQEITHSFVQDFVNAGADESHQADIDDGSPVECNSTTNDANLPELSDDPSVSNLSLPNCEQKLTSTQQYPQLVHQSEADLSMSADDRSDNGLSTNQL